MSVVFSCCWTSALDSQRTCIVVVSLHVCYRQLIPIGSFVGSDAEIRFRCPDCRYEERKKHVDAVCFHSGCGARNMPGSSVCLQTTQSGTLLGRWKGESGYALRQTTAISAWEPRFWHGRSKFVEKVNVSYIVLWGLPHVGA